MFENNPAEPGGECLWRVDPIQYGQGLDERFLRRILGRVEVTQDRERVSHSHVLEAADNLVHSGGVTGLSTFENLFECVVQELY